MPRAKRPKRVSSAKVSKRLPLLVSFDGGEITSNAGVVLLRLIDEKYQITERIARCWRDRRDQRYVKHDLCTLLRQRLYQIACGYPDTNDTDTLRDDPALVASARGTEAGKKPLASQPTLSRLENSADSRIVYHLNQLLVELFFEVMEEPEEVILDVDATHAKTHGGQQLSFFNAYYDDHVYLPLVIYEGHTGFPLAVVLRPGNRHASHRSVEILERLIGRIKRQWPGTRILVRADSGFAGPEMFEMLDREGVDYLIGLIRNRRLEREVLEVFARLRRKKKAKRRQHFTSFRYAARSWNRKRRVVARVQITHGEDNPRFVVTNMRSGSAEDLYGLYCERAVGSEANIKELKNTFFGHRMSCRRFWANQARLLFSAFAHVLVLLLRRAIERTEWTRRSLATIRLHFLKVGASVRWCVRHVRFRLPTAFPEKGVFAELIAKMAPRQGWEIGLG